MSLQLLPPSSRCPSTPPASSSQPQEGKAEPLLGLCGSQGTVMSHCEHFRITFMKCSEKLLWLSCTQDFSMATAPGHHPNLPCLLATHPSSSCDSRPVPVIDSGEPKFFSPGLWAVQICSFRCSSSLQIQQVLNKSCVFERHFPRCFVLASRAQAIWPEKPPCSDPAW